MGHRSMSTSVVLATVAFTGCGGTVDPDPDVPTECLPAITTTLAVGASAEYSELAARFFCVEAVGADQEFVVVALAASDNSIPVRVRSENTIGVFGPPSPSMASAIGGGFQPRSGGDNGLRFPDYRLHEELRAAERRELTPLVRAGVTRFTSPLLNALSNPSVGETITLNANSNADQACSNPLNIGARVMAISQHAIVVADTLNPSGGFDTNDYEFYAETFDDLLFPIAEENFGLPADIDGNGKTVIFFTKEVNRRTAPGSGSFVAGFFFSRDLFPRSGGGGLQGCAASNEAELLYLLVPDPAGTINGNDFSLADVRRYTVGTISHEYQHLVNASRRLYVTALTGSDWNEETWLNEGLSHIAEELVFYEEAGVGPEQNLTFLNITDDSTPEVLDAFNRHQIFNLARLTDHLENPNSSSVYNPADGLATRGAAWSFLRYAMDRTSGAQSAFVHDLVNSTTNGLDNLAEVMGGEGVVYEWMTDWAVSLYADDRVTGAPARHRDASWHQPSIQGALNGSVYPLLTQTLPPGVDRDQTLIRGGSAYLRFGVDTGAVGQVEITSSGNIPPATLRVVLLRTK